MTSERERYALSNYCFFVSLLSLSLSRSIAVQARMLFIFWWLDKCSILIGIRSRIWANNWYLRVALLVSQKLKYVPNKNGIALTLRPMPFPLPLPWSLKYARFSFCVYLFFLLIICMLFVCRRYFTLFEFLIGFFVLLLFSAHSLSLPLALALFIRLRSHSDQM